MKKNSHRLYEVRKDKKAGDWKIVTGRGSCVKRATTRREAVRAGRQRARTAAEEFGINTTLRIKNTDGTISEQFSYTAQ